MRTALIFPFLLFGCVSAPQQAPLTPYKPGGFTQAEFNRDATICEGETNRTIVGVPNAAINPEVLDSIFYGCMATRGYEFR